MDRQKKYGILLSYMAHLVHIVTGIVYTPLMITYLGRSEYGVYQLAVSVIMYLNLLFFGFNSSYMKFYANKKAQDDEEGVAKVNGMFMIIFLFLSFMCLVIGSIIALNIDLIFSKGLTSAEYAKTRVLLTILLVDLAITFPNTAFNCIIASKERFIFQKTLILLQYLLSPAILVLLLIKGYGSVGVVCLALGITIVLFITNIIYCFKVLKVRFIFKGFDFSLLKDTCRFTFFIFLFQIADKINVYTDSLLVGRYLGSEEAAVYSIAIQIMLIFCNFGTTITTVFIPEVNMLISNGGDSKKVNELFVKVCRIEYFFIAWIFMGFVFFGKQFICIWAGEDFSAAYYVCLLLLIPRTVILIEDVAQEIQLAYNKHRRSAVVCFGLALLNIIISIPLTKYYGIIGAAFGTFIALVIYGVIYFNIYLKKVIKLDLKKLIISFKSFVIPTIVSVIFALIYTYLVDCASMIRFVLGALLFTVVYWTLMYIKGMNDEERKTLEVSIIKRIRK